MNRRNFFKGAALTGLPLGSCVARSAAATEISGITLPSPELPILDPPAIVDPILKPRIETIPPVSQRARGFFRNEQVLVWDNVMPELDYIDVILRRWHAVGVNFTSYSLDGTADTEANVRDIAFRRRQIRERSDYLAYADSVVAIQQAKSAGKLAVGFNFQDTLPFGRDLANVRRFYDLGVRQAGLAYNNRNYVGDGCAEPVDAGLSLFGRALVREMNRVGMIIDGSHVGHRTTLEAMEISTQPFVFSHSNPFAIRPHYRSIRDDQIKACAASGGVIGINGVGFWVGDVDAPTEAIFRCLDYTVQLVGPDHVGLGFDYIYDLDRLIREVRADPILWPPYKGEWMVRHNYAGAEQMVQLVQHMLDHQYPDSAIVAILGANWRRVAAQVWK